MYSTIPEGNVLSVLATKRSTSAASEGYQVSVLQASFQLHFALQLAAIRTQPPPDVAQARTPPVVR